jgi:hypothetical protein
MDANEAQEEYEEVQSELRKKEEEVGYRFIFCVFSTVNGGGLIEAYTSFRQKVMVL